MTTHIRATGYADLVGMVPTFLGFVPARTAVLLGFAPTEGGGGVAHLVATALYEYDRVGADEADLWRTAVRALLAQGATNAVVVHYEDAPQQAVGAHIALEVALSESPLQVDEVMRVIGGRLYTLSDAVDGGGVLHGDIGSGVPVPGRADLPELAPLVAQGVGAPASSLADLVQSFRVASGEVDRVARVEVACREALQDGGEVSKAFAGLAMVLGVNCEDTPVDQLPDIALASAIVGLSDVRVRDAVMAWLAPGMLPIGPDSGPYMEVMPRISGCEGFTSDLEGRGAMRERLRVFLTLCPRQRSAPVAALVGLHLWRLGDGVIARRVWEAAQDVEPDYVLVGLFLQALGEGMRCVAS